MSRAHFRQDSVIFRFRGKQSRCTCFPVGERKYGGAFILYPVSFTRPPHMANTNGRLATFTGVKRPSADDSPGWSDRLPMTPLGYLGRSRKGCCAAIPPAWGTWIMRGGHRPVIRAGLSKVKITSWIARGGHRSVIGSISRQSIMRIFRSPVRFGMLRVPSRRVLALPEVQHERLTAFLPGLHQDVVHMRLDGAHGEEQLVGDLLVVLAQDD